MAKTYTYVLIRSSKTIQKLKDLGYTVTNIAEDFIDTYKISI